MNLPLWRCHKEVHAAKILRVVEHRPEPGDSCVGACLFLEDPDAPGAIDTERAVMVSPEWLHKHNPLSGGYFVEYEDGYRSYSPASAFEKGYTRVYVYRGPAAGRGRG